MVKQNVLELFSGTHSWGKELHKKYNVVSLDRDMGGDCALGSGYKSALHIQQDIMTWDYKVYKPNHFYLITASPVCNIWSNLKNTWIGRKLKEHGDTIITKEILQQDIDKFGKPMVDKMIEIIEYFKPTYYIIENPYLSKMRHYILEAYPQYSSKNVLASYCKYSDWGYEKKTRFWTNINITPKICNKDCDNIILLKDKKLHKERMGTSKSVMVDGNIIRVNTKALRTQYKDHINLQKDKSYKKEASIIERYRIPPDLIKEFINLI